MYRYRCATHNNTHIPGGPPDQTKVSLGGGGGGSAGGGGIPIPMRDILPARESFRRCIGSVGGGGGVNVLFFLCFLCFLFFFSCSILCWVSAAVGGMSPGGGDNRVGGAPGETKTAPGGGGKLLASPLYAG